MDSLSQIALGAAVSVATLGRRTAVWKAALWGGIAGTLPDLDVLIDHGDALRNMTEHRGFSHSLFWLTLASPLLAALPAWTHGQGALFRRWWLAIWLALVTHPLLDAMTVYGTRLLLPFSDHPFAVGSVFIIDPLYTVPLVVGVVVALSRREWRGLGANRAGLVLSTAYLAWSALAQWHVRDVTQDALAAAGTPHRPLLVTATPFNTLLWRVVAMHPDGSYDEGFYALADAGRPPTLDRFAGTPGLREELGGMDAVRRLGGFAQGFYKLHEQGGEAWITDLRMGQEPHYSFSFRIARRNSPVWSAVRPRSDGSRGDAGRILAWMGERIRGRDLPPPR